MVLYFSGTGNSKMVAKQLADILNEPLLNIEEGEMVYLKDDEPLGIVFPVYAWGMPQIVDRYLRKMEVGNRYVWSVMTCGDDIGYTDKRLERALRHKMDAAFSVQMPNTYVCLPGFKVDENEVAHRKVSTTHERLPEIAKRIRQKAACREVTRGGMAWIKTYVLGPVFNGLLLTDKKFKASDDCTSCGLCAKQCPTRNITLNAQQHPTWTHVDCTGCLRCFHKCPHRAIDWGSYTKGKAQVQKVSAQHRS